MDSKCSQKVRRRYDRIAPFYELMDWMIPDKLRKQAVSLAQGKVLEVGVGTGKNLPFYSKDVDVTGIDLSPRMLERAKKKVEGLGIPIKLMEMDAEHLAFPDNSFDTVIATFVFCSVADPIDGLKEIRRVAKPGGQVILLEHVRSDNRILGALMDFVNPIVVRMIGANINRQTVENVKRAGLLITEVKDVRGPIFKLIRAVP